MPSKFRKAIDAVKDQTSISLAKVSSGANPSAATALEVAVLKATTHDNGPLDHRYLAEILSLISANKAHAAAAAAVLAKRITKTRNWIVALKSLNLVLRIFQDGDPYFPREVLLAMKRGAKILNLSNFRDDSNSSPWDYTAFVRTFALYLDERLDCFLTGKLQKRFTNRKPDSDHARTRRRTEPIRDMKPAMLIDRISYWQKLLDRAIATKPTGPARSNRLVLYTLHAVVQESFDLYRDISDGLALLLDSFFHLQYQSCVNAFQACVKASKQFEELGSFYELCKSIGVGRTSEYPSVQQPSDELIETLQEFLKDQASFPCHGNPSPPPAQVHLTARDSILCSNDDLEQSESSDRNSLGSWTSPTNSVEQDGESFSDYQQSQFGDFESNPTPNFAFFDDGPEENGQIQIGAPSGRLGDWELVLAESATEPPPQEWPDFFAPSIGDDDFVKSLAPENNYNNPFLLEAEDLFAVAPTFTAEFPGAETGAAPTFTAEFPEAETGIAPTFRAQSFSEEATAVAPTFRAETASFAEPTKERNEFTFDSPAENDPFAEATNEESLLEQQRLWKEQQNKIIAKHLLA